MNIKHVAIRLTLLPLVLLAMNAFGILIVPPPIIPVVELATYDWTGRCTDCVAGAGDTLAEASLVLSSATFPDGTEAWRNRFDSFRYRSELFPSGLDSSGASQVVMYGDIPPIGPASFYLSALFTSELAQSFTFEARSDGLWNLYTSACAGSGCAAPADIGYGSRFSSVPEPAAIVLLGLGLGGLAWRRRKTW